MRPRTGRVAVPTGNGHPPVPGMVAALAVTQTVGYGTLYYAFAAVLEPVATDLGTSHAAVTGALTLSVLVTALGTIPVGRFMDRHGGHGLMTAGSVLGAASLLGWAAATTVPQLYAAFAGIGIAAAMVLYEPAFAVLVAVCDPARRARALLTVTIVAGFASSIFIPLTGFLTDRYGWRTAIAVLAVGHAAVAVPLHAGFLRGTRPVRAPAVTTQVRSASRTALRDPGFWLLVTAFVVNNAAISGVGVHLVWMLVWLGHPVTLAATVTGLVGVLSVTGRVLVTGLSRRMPLGTVTAAVFAVQGAAAAVLPLLGRSVAGAVTCVALFGLGFGVATIARPAILADRYGATGYATIAGTLAAPTTVAKALAPLGAAGLVALSGYPAVTTAAAVACLVGTACLLAVRPVTDRSGP